MAVLSVLEQKIAALIVLVAEYKKKNKQLQAAKDKIDATYNELKIENARLAEENAQLLAKLSTLENSLLKDTQQLEELKEEEKITKSMVDSLIKSIDALVEKQ